MRITRLAALSLLGVVAVTMPGCGTTGGLPATSIGNTLSAVAGFTITQGQLDAARNTYDATVLAPLRTYARWPRCRTGQTITLAAPCHDRALLAKIREGDKVAARAFVNAQNAITNGDNTGIAAAWNTLNAAIDAATQLISISGVNG